jgi:hypothetical protein|tara:strand:- start:2436 stop:2804 length:369 start_codon:yes stop_codon:yes gene_type:complete
MADFPSLSPQTRTYTPGSFAVLRTETLLGDEFSLRKNNAAVDHRLTLTFANDSTAHSDTIFAHYAVHHRFQPFDLPDEVYAGATFTLPANYQWIYARPPEVSFSAGNVEVLVELVLVAPYNI